MILTFLNKERIYKSKYKQMIGLELLQNFNTKMGLKQNFNGKEKFSFLLKEILFQTITMVLTSLTGLYKESTL